MEFFLYYYCKEFVKDSALDLIKISPFHVLIFNLAETKLFFELTILRL